MQRQKAIWVISVIMSVLIIAPGVYHAEQESDMEVHFIDVGQGTAYLSRRQLIKTF
ncbi:hypothetical protein [Lentibacillus amyloliquefaciens]|uniref:hypothetical protein n=1 Tax=Lentibacillus amyloliquefaciens TaxID=1472767 RepID=UPI001F1DDDD0|nr:hypothetical protein [Lentibacillus amyloliquefaciens]